jgi:hypothetical protein
MEGSHLLISLLWKAKSLGKRPRFAKTLSNTLAFTSPRDNAGSTLRGNRLYVLFQPLRPTSKLESFWELQISVEPGSPITPCCPNPSIKTQRGRMGAFVMGEGARESL